LAGQPLLDRLAVIAAPPETLAPMAEPGFYADSLPWLEAAAAWARGALDHVDALAAIRGGHGEAATVAALAAAAERDAARRPAVSDLVNGTVQPDQIVAEVGDGVFEAFFDRAEAEYASWLDAVPPAGYAPYP